MDGQDFFANGAPAGCFRGAIFSNNLIRWEKSPAKPLPISPKTDFRQN
jgi:hypothetical protein